MSILLPLWVLKNSPSSQNGISAEQEQRYRIFGCELIQEMGILLRLPQVVMATGQTLFHRFFYRKSLTRYDAPPVALTALFLAAKVEEADSATLLGDVLKVYNCCFHRRKGRTHELLVRGGPQYSKLKQQLLSIERYLLKELGFSLNMDHPHRYILHYIQFLEMNEDTEFAQCAWNYINDSMRLDLCVRHRSEAVACAGIYLAAKKLGRSLPQSPPWHTVFGATSDEISAISESVLRLYEQPKIGWLPSLLKSAKQHQSASQNSDQTNGTINNATSRPLVSLGTATTAVNTAAPPKHISSINSNGNSRAEQQPPPATKPESQSSTESSKSADSPKKSQKETSDRVTQKSKEKQSSSGKSSKSRKRHRDHKDDRSSSRRDSRDHRDRDRRDYRRDRRDRDRDRDRDRNRDRRSHDRGW